jgi:membrane protease YdiL (CAAX protease family)
MEPQLSDSRRIYSRVGFALLAMLVLDLAGQVGAQLLAARFGWTIESGTWGYYIVAMLPQYLIAMPVSAAIIARVPARSGAAQSALTRRQFLIAGAICLFLMYAGNLLGVLVSDAISLLAGKQMVNLLEQLVTGSDFWASTVFIVLIAPVAEELFFRKLLIDRLGGMGQRTAVIVSALVFALAHGSIAQVFYAFALGLAFGVIYIKTNRIDYTIALHMAINTLGGALPLLMMNAGDTITAAYGMLMFAGVVFGLVQFVRRRKRLGFSDEAEPGLSVAWKKEALINAGMILFIAACLALFVWNTVYALQ